MFLSWPRSTRIVREFATNRQIRANSMKVFFMGFRQYSRLGKKQELDMIELRRARIYVLN